MKNKFLQRVGNYFKNIPARFKNFFGNSGRETYASMCLMGTGQMLNGQYVKGLLYLLAEVAFVAYFALRGVGDIIGFFTLGTQKADAWLGIEGDNSVIMLLWGIFAWFALVVLVALWVSNIKDAQKYADMRPFKTLPTFKDDLSSLLNKNFCKFILVLPLVGVGIFNVLPIVFMILIAFTNYGGDIVPPELVDWSLDSFKKLVALGELSQSFVKILGWNLLWAFASTFANYFMGLGLALLFNKKCVKGKAIWRAFPVLAYAMPGFITLLAFKFMFSNGGPINNMIVADGGKIIDFFGINSTWMSRGIGFFVNAWLSVPSIMLLATGILSNINADLYEAAKIDGASSWVQFKKITLPFVIFSTTPVLISQFIGNFNNFGVFFFLRSNVTSEGYFLASDTDLLINWLYRMSIDKNYYSIGAAISLVIFIITSVLSLIVYVRSASYKKEDTFR
ncbi:MAG TPA: sugar ABC transporter permease [Candidatus Fimimonas gallinarum]|uniref:Maltose/maltodextrin transport system permease protein n=1 Tax=Candidatus Fimimonas gallinarum TaxID=2840821 RepID=A0A9D1J7P4_9BACT|nr:sugar ABC transporter permease [Candidatus Fimimonas gallinarum]